MEETFDHALGNEKDLVLPLWRYRTNLGDFRHRRTMILKVCENGRKSWKGNSTTCEWIFHQLAAKNLNVNAVQWSIASVIRYSIGKKKNYSIHYLTGQNRGSGVRANKHLASHRDRRPAVRYFEPWKWTERCSYSTYPFPLSPIPSLFSLPPNPQARATPAPCYTS